MRNQDMKQAAFKFRTWGGRRKGAGRKPTRERAGVGHRRREVLKARFPVHVTWRMRSDVWNLRTRRCFTALAAAFWGGRERFGFRLVHFSVQGNHVHLLVEAKDERALSKGMCGLGVRVARGLNKVMGRAGKVLDDRYHAHVLRTPTEVRRARNYLLQNALKHYGQLVPDRYTSVVAVVAPETFLMRRLC
jgi:REP element-mobilizing transposase RayT